MKIKERFYLLIEFLRPASAGGYFDGQKLYLHGGARKPARLYIAVSHKELYFGRLALSGLDGKRLQKAAELEALRLLALMGLEGASPAVAAFSANSEIIFVYRERNFFENILSDLPPGFIPCGIFPAGLALLPPEPRDGLYAFFLEDRCEGVVIEKGHIKEFLPVNPEAARVFVDEYKGEKFIKQGNGADYIAASASEIVRLPPELRLALAPYPIRPRPHPSSKTVLLLLFPLLLSGISFYIQKTNQALEAQLRLREKKISQIQKELQKIDDEIASYERQKKAREELAKFNEKKRDVYVFLKDLTDIFPEGAWINRFNLNLNQGRLILSGEADDILSIVKRLKNLPWVSEVKLSTVTRNSSTDKEHFQLTIELAQPRLSE